MDLLNLEIGLLLITAFLLGLALLLGIGLGRARRQRRGLGVLGFLLAAAALAWLCYRCVVVNGPAIQERLQSEAVRALQAAAIPGVRIDADGRDLVLGGSVTSASLRAEAGERAFGVAGVRTVDNRITVAPAATRTVDPRAAQQRIDRILSSRQIEFETGREALLTSSVPVLEELLAVLREVPEAAVRVEGHTDDTGDAAANRALSLARARAVMAWLRARGVTEARMEAVGFGPDRPVASNSTAAGRARNRRVDIVAR